MPFVNLPLFIGFSFSYSIDCKEESPIITRNLFQMSSKSCSEMCFYSLHCGRQCQKWEKAFCGHCHNNLKCYCCYGIEYGELVTDVLNLQQHCLTCKALFVPRHILNTVYGLANFATRVPVHQSWVHPALLKAYCYCCYKKKKKRILIVNYNRIMVIQNRCNFLFYNFFFYINFYL